MVSGLAIVRDLCEGLSAQLRTQLGELFAITILELHAPGNLLTEDTILGIEIGITKPDLFVNRRSDRP